MINTVPPDCQRSCNKTELNASFKLDGAYKTVLNKVAPTRSQMYVHVENNRQCDGAQERPRTSSRVRSDKYGLDMYWKENEKKSC